jgi:heme exporter protein D
MRLGVGGGAFGVRGGISTRGLGVGVGPFSAGTSWRRRGSGGGGFFAWLIVAMFVILIVAWPYLLGTYIAVQLGATDPSTARAAIGWFFEVLYIAGLIAWFVLSREKRAQQVRDEAQRFADLAASGAVFQTQAGRTLAYRHGACTVNHRSHATAERCPNG